MAVGRVNISGGNNIFDLFSNELPLNLLGDSTKGVLDSSGSWEASMYILNKSKKIMRYDANNRDINIFDYKGNLVQKNTLPNLVHWFDGEYFINSGGVEVYDINGNLISSIPRYASNSSYCFSYKDGLFMSTFNGKIIIQDSNGNLINTITVKTTDGKDYIMSNTFNALKTKEGIVLSRTNMTGGPHDSTVFLYPHGVYDKAKVVFVTSLNVTDI